MIIGIALFDIFSDHVAEAKKPWGELPVFDDVKPSEIVPKLSALLADLEQRFIVPLESLSPEVVPSSPLQS